LEQTASRCSQQGTSFSLALYSSSIHDKLLTCYNHFKQERTVEEKKAHAKKLISKEEKKRKQLAAMGIEYDFPGFATSCKTETA
jgi:hypothetical protein